MNLRLVAIAAGLMLLCLAYTVVIERYFPQCPRCTQGLTRFSDSGRYAYCARCGYARRG